MVGYRARTVLMVATLALGYRTLRDDRSLQLELSAEKAKLDAVTTSLRGDLAELRARQERLSAALRDAQANAGNICQVSQDAVSTTKHQE